MQDRRLQRSYRRQREKQKISRLTISKTTTLHIAARFFVHFFTVVARLSDISETAYFTFSGWCEHLDTIL